MSAISIGELVSAEDYPFTDARFLPPDQAASLCADLTETGISLTHIIDDPAEAIKHLQRITADNTGNPEPLSEDRIAAVVDALTRANNPLRLVLLEYVDPDGAFDAFRHVRHESALEALRSVDPHAAATYVGSLAPFDFATVPSPKAAEKAFSSFTGRVATTGRGLLRLIK